MLYGNSVLTVNRCLKILKTDLADNEASISHFIPAGKYNNNTHSNTTCTGLLPLILPGLQCDLHFDLTGFLVITEGAGELSVQCSRHLLLWRCLSLRLSPSHFLL